MRKIRASQIKHPARNSRPVFLPVPLSGLRDDVDAHLWVVSNWLWRRFLAITVVGLFAVGLAGCSSSSSSPPLGQGPYRGHNAAWFSKSQNSDSLHAQLVWCAKHDPQMNVTACASAKKGYTLIGGHWNQSVIDMLK
ncbi:MAG: hypothetical protein ACYCXG_01835 [Acidiferrobacter sp.]